MVKLLRQKGILVMEVPIIMLLFFMVVVLANNGIVGIIRQEWHNAANAAAYAGMV